MTATYLVRARCRKCGTDVVGTPPQLGTLAARVDRQVRCTNTTCGALLWLWSTSTGTGA